MTRGKLEASEKTRENAVLTLQTPVNYATCCAQTVPQTSKTSHKIHIRI